YDNWECAIVDNASTDATPEIAASFSKRESRIRHLRFEEFVDAGENHNRAFDSINPESTFCKVVQADDWLYSHCLAEMVAAAGASETVGVVSSYQLWGEHVHLNGLPYQTTLAEGHDILRNTLLGRFNVTGNATANMVRSSLIRERRPFYRVEFLHH